MTSIIDLFKPAAHIAPIECSEEQSKKYKYWRFRILYAMFIGYAVYYLTRGTLAIVMPELKLLGYDEIYLGWMITFFQVSYGVSKFVNGLLADKANARYFMAWGLIFSGVVSLLFGVTGSIVGLLIFWTLNGWFQGCGSAPCHRLLSHWYSPSERGRWWSVWNTSHNVGAAVLPLIGAYFLVQYSWEYVLFVPGFIAIFSGFFLINRLRDTPQSLGLPSVEEYRNDFPPESSKDQIDKELSFREILGKYIFSNKLLWILAVAYFMVYVIRWTISHWAFYFLVDSHNYEVWQAAKCIWWYEIGGFFGSIAAGWFSDLVFKGNRPIVNFCFFLGMVPFLSLFSYFSSIGASPVILQAVMGGIGFFVFGPQMLLAVHAVEVTHKNASATAVGFLGIIAYLGAAMTGGPLGHFVKHGGWENVFTLLQICGVLGALSCLPLLFFKAQRRVSI